MFRYLADIHTVGAIIRDICIILVPVILGVAALFIPRAWQVRERDFETKKKLVTQISDIVMSTIMALFVNKDKKPPDGEKQFWDDAMRDAYNRWKVQTCVIGSEIHAYFPTAQNSSPPLHVQWRVFSDQVSEFFKTWQAKFETIPEGTWEALKEFLFQQKASLIAQILLSKIEGFEKCDPQLPKAIDKWPPKTVKVGEPPKTIDVIGWPSSSNVQ
jgi:hypothetical protein